MTAWRRSPLVRTFGLVLRAHRGLTVAWIAAALGQGALTPLIAYTGKRVADAIVARSAADVVRWVVWELVLATATAALMRLAADARQLLRSRVRLETRVQIAEKVGELELAQLEDPAVQDRIDTARASADARPLTLVHETLIVARSVLGLAIYAGLLSRFSPWALLFFLAVIPGAVAELWRARRAARAQRARMQDARRVRYLQDAMFSDALAAENRLYRMTPLLLDRSHALGRQLFDETRAAWRRSLAVSLACQLLPTLMVNGTYLAMAIATVRGQLTLGELTLYGISLTSAQRLSQAILLSGRSVLDGWQHLRTLFDLLDLPRAAPAAPQLVVVADAAPRAQPRIEARGDARGDAASSRAGLRLESVGFRYPGGGAWALRGIDLEIDPGDFVAIVGGNGDGKTTLVKLITGLLRPTEGRISLAGRDLARWDPAELRRRFAVVFQGFARYGMTLRDNVEIGRERAVSPGELAAVLRASGADDVAARLARGVDTELVPSIAGGAGLSGGQWQRVALARGLVRDAADYLVLDEPTSALDAATEPRIVDHLRSLQGDKAIVLITHRSSLLRPSDKIVLLERGRLIRDDAPALLRHPRWTAGAAGEA